MSAAKKNIIPAATWFHGTASEFDEFDLYYGGDNTSYPGSDEAIFFAGSRGAAAHYKDLSETRLSEIREEEEADGVDEDDLTVVRPRIIEVQIAADAKILDTGVEDEIEIDGDTYSINDDARVLRAARRAGFDAVIWPHGNANNEGRTLAVVRPSVIIITKN